MTRRSLVAAAVLAVAAIGVCALALRGGALRRDRLAPGREPRMAGPREAAARERLRTIPLYRALADSDALRAASLDSDGTLHVELDLRSYASPRLASIGFASLATLLPEAVQGTIAPVGAAGSEPGAAWAESWLVSESTPALDLLDRADDSAVPSRAWDALSGNPTAVVAAHMLPARLADPSLGGPAFAPWRDRLAVVETLLGRPLRTEFAEDLAGPVVFALYDDANGSGADAILSVELKRSDRIAALLETLFGLGALTERATISRYRGVATGSFESGSGGPGLALAVDGPLLLVATSRARLESAIDARRLAPGGGRSAEAAVDATASWSAMSVSAFGRSVRPAGVSKGTGLLPRSPPIPSCRTRDRCSGSASAKGADRCGTCGPTP
jgi:hypothetical protein